MSDFFILDFLIVLLFGAAIALLFYRRLNSRRKSISRQSMDDPFAEKFRKIFFSTLSEIIAADELDKSFSAIANGIMETFDGSVFIFRRNGESAGLIRYAANDLDRISSLFVKLGLKLDVNAIPLRGGRVKVFASGYNEFEDPFPLIGDLATSAACRKIQNELKLNLISTTSVKTESGDYLMVLLLPARIHDVRSYIGQFGSLLNYAVYLSNLKKKLADFEKKFDEQFIRMKNEFLEKEGTHVRLYDDMPIPAAVLDESGIVVEANQALKGLFGEKVEAIGQPFSIIIDEEDRQKFVEILLNLKIEKDSIFPLVVSEKHFKARIIAITEKNQVVVYLLDETAGVNLRVELERTIDGLRKESEFADKLVGEERKHSADIVRNSLLPVIAVLDGKIESASESARQNFSIAEGESLNEFSSRNKVPALSTSEAAFEMRVSDGRTFAGSQWESGGYRYFAFNDVSELKKAENDIRRFSNESGKLFNGILPVARVRENKIVEWNDLFGTLLKDFLALDKGFDAFLRYLSEYPDSIKSELQSNNEVKRTCRTTDRKSLNVCFSPVESSVFIFIEDITEQENLKQHLRNTQNLLANSIEFFSEEPIFVLENGMVSAANLAARNKLDIKLDEALNVDSLFTGIGAMDRSSAVKLDGKFFRIENATLNNSTVFHFRTVTEEIAQRAEINRLKLRHDLLKELATSDRYEDILTNLKETLGNDYSPKLICAGILYAARESADVYLLTVSTGKIEPSLSLSLSPSDMSFVEHGGKFSKIELPDTTFLNIISSGASMLAIESTSVGDARGFASVALAEEFQSDSSISGSSGRKEIIERQVVDEISKVLEVASSTAVDIHTRSSAQRKFEESGKVTRALVGLTGISDGSFNEISRRAVDLLKQVFGADSIGVYFIDGPALTLSAANGNLPNSVPIPGIKFGLMVPAPQLISDLSLVKGNEMISSEGIYFVLKSRQQKLALMFKFIGIPPAPSELNAVSSIALDLLESKRATETHAKVASNLSDESKSVYDFITGLSRGANPQDVIKILGDSLIQRNKDSTVLITAEANPESPAKPLEAVRKEEEGHAVYEANFLSFGIGIIKIRTSIDSFSRMMVDLAIDKLRSLLALKLPAAQSESVGLQNKLDRAQSDLSSLRDSVDKIPASLRNARIEIDGVLSRLAFVQGDEKIIQEIKIRLASASKELSIDLDSSYVNQDAIFEKIREGVMEHADAGKRIRSFDISVLTEFRAEFSISELIKDLFVNFIITSEAPDCEALMMTAQPSPNELASGKGKHINIRLAVKEGVVLHEDKVKRNESINTLVNKIERMGYQIDIRTIGNEFTMDVCEIKNTSSPKEESAILVEDDRALLEEESQSLLHIFSHLKVARDAVEAAKIFESEKFGAAFIDLSLPSINGIELCQQIKKAQPECITILLTNREGEEKSNGVDHIMLRPMNEETVRSLVKK